MWACDGTGGSPVLDLVEVHRFANGGVRAPDGSLRWDIRRIHREVLEGIRLAAASGPVDAIGIDSWGVDYGLLDAAGELVTDPYSHRDARTDGVAEKVLDRLGADTLYAETGIQQLPFNTLYQLSVDTHLADAETLLLVPDLLGYWLTGERGAERTNASTTQLYGARSHAWSTDLLARLDLPTRLLPPLRSPGDVVGTLLPAVAASVGLPPETPVIAVGSHDTASAVVGVPAGDAPYAYVSSGTWSLVGLELDAPVLTTEAREADFTNEAGVDGTVRFLRNVSGLWVLSECLRQWADDGTPDSDLASVLDAAAALPGEWPRRRRGRPPAAAAGRHAGPGRDAGGRRRASTCRRHRGSTPGWSSTAWPRPTAATCVRRRRWPAWSRRWCTWSAAGPRTGCSASSRPTPAACPWWPVRRRLLPWATCSCRRGRWEWRCRR